MPLRCCKGRLTEQVRNDAPGNPPRTKKQSSSSGQSPVLPNSAVLEADFAAACTDQHSPQHPSKQGRQCIQLSALHASCFKAGWQHIAAANSVTGHNLPRSRVLQRSPCSSAYKIISSTRFTFRTGRLMAGEGDRLRLGVFAARSSLASTGRLCTCSHIAPCQRDHTWSNSAVVLICASLLYLSACRRTAHTYDGIGCH